MEMTEQELEKKIKTASIVARVCIFASVLFIGFGAVLHLSTGDPNANYIMLTGLVFVALCGVAAYTKKNLVERKQGGKTFHQGG
jgi:hypothetical protein